MWQINAGETEVVDDEEAVAGEAAQVETETVDGSTTDEDHLEDLRLIVTGVKVTKSNIAVLEETIVGTAIVDGITIIFITGIDHRQLEADIATEVALALLHVTIVVTGLRPARIAGIDLCLAIATRIVLPGVAVTLALVIMITARMIVGAAGLVPQATVIADTVLECSIFVERRDWRMLSAPGFIIL